MRKYYFICIMCLCVLVAGCAENEDVGVIGYEVLKKELNHPDENRRAAAAMSILSDYPNRSKDEILDIMIGLMDDEHWKVQLAAAFCLGEIGPKAKEALPRLELLLLHPEWGDSSRKTIKDAIEKIEDDDNTKGV